MEFSHIQFLVAPVDFNCLNCNGVWKWGASTAQYERMAAHIKEHFWVCPVCGSSDITFSKCDDHEAAIRLRDAIPKPLIDEFVAKFFTLTLEQQIPALQSLLRDYYDQVESNSCSALAETELGRIVNNLNQG